MTFVQLNQENPYYCNIERPKLIKNLNRNIENIESRIESKRVNRLNSAKSNECININEKKFKQIRQSSAETIRKKKYLPFKFIYLKFSGKIEIASHNKLFCKKLIRICDKDIVKLN